MDTKKRNILYISAWYPDRINPNLGNFVEKHAKAIAAYCNVNVLHIAFDANLIDKKYDLINETTDNINVVKVYIKKDFFRIIPFTSIQKIFLYIKAYIIGYRYIVNTFGKQDMVHANIVFPTGLIALYFKFKFHLKYIITEHWTGYLPNDPSKISRFNKFIAEKVIKNARFVVPVSEDLKNAMLSYDLLGNYKVIPNVVDVNLFKPKINKAKNNKIRFLHVSSLDDAQKNISGIINVVSKLARTYTNFELIIVGDGDNSSFVKKTMELNLLNSFIYFEKEKKQEEIAEIMQNSDCFLMFSNYESFSVVLAEALACGLPIIATDAGGISSELTNEYGIIIKPNDENALLEAMTSMISHYSDYDAHYLAAYSAKYSYENVGKSYYNLYQEILN